ncbi:hypothetical protein WQQ_41040 [Hydrocarboniphaga effusa AP103]|uniref:Uncharacterized protein n=1 Tax=Hydrocarboniphaga effusa AP103 TaxID=1172194 RepID=I7Z798_9GAMM|nr:hypothetical protein WQQ_41040 [Hydrocarboniphaga effusa AP103]
MEFIESRVDRSWAIAGTPFAEGLLRSVAAGTRSVPAANLRKAA